MEASGEVERLEERWFLRGEAVSGLPELQRRAEESADRILEEHRLLLSLLKRLPAVRLLGISGSVAWRNHGRRNGKVPDLDLFVISSPGGVHVVRMLLRVWDGVERMLRRVGLVRPRATVCPSYLTDASFLEITNKSFYTASDAVTVRILKGGDQFSVFLAENAWIARYYPLEFSEPMVGPASAAGWVLKTANAGCFAVMAAASWVKMQFGRLRGGPPPVGFQYSLRFRFDTNVSWKRSAPAGGGHQPEVARRFADLYARHFGLDEDLQAFLFPGTTATGVCVANSHARSTIVKPLGYHE